MQPVPAPPVPDGFWLVMAGCQGLSCGAMSTLMLVSVLCMWLMFVRAQARLNDERRKRKVREYMS